MLPRNSRTLWPLAMVSALILGLTGCWNPFSPDEAEDKDDHPIEIVDRTSRVNLIQFFAKAHEDRDADDYGLSLHEDYQFWFSEDDRGDPGWDWTDWISKAIDVGITTNMFAAEEVTDIRVDFVNQTSVSGAQTDEDNFNTIILDVDPPVTVHWADFLVDMHVIEETSEDRIDHWVDGRAYIYFRPDPNFEGEWQIWKIEDKGNDHKKGGESTSWGNLKREMR